MSMISTLAALPYELARLPLTALDGVLSRQLPESSPPRTTLSRAIGSADKLAGALMRNNEIADRGNDRLERATNLAKVEQLETDAEARREEARETAEVARQEAARKREVAADLAATALVEAKKAEAKGKQKAAASAKKTAAAKKAAANKKAASRTATVQKRKATVDATAETKKKASRNEAKILLGEARESKEAAAKARADAETLSEITDSEKQKWLAGRQELATWPTL